MDDLRNHTKYVLPIKEEKKKEPLYVYHVRPKNIWLITCSKVPYLYFRRPRIWGPPSTNGSKICICRMQQSCSRIWHDKGRFVLHPEGNSKQSKLPSLSPSLLCLPKTFKHQYEVLIGKARASMIMGHIDSTSLKYYSHNTGNIDLVGITMDELPRSHDINNLVCII